MVIKTARFPLPGETILGGEFLMSMGGKGANQALAAKRLGGDVSFVGKIGRDIFGKKAMEYLKNEGVNVDYVKTDPEKHSGIAVITVNQTGENSIIVADSSNYSLSPSDIMNIFNVIDSCEILLLQLEIPIETVSFIAEYASEMNKTIILNPAPAEILPDSLYRKISIIIPNESEAEKLTGISVKDESSALEAASTLVNKGVKRVIITMGSRGAYVYDKGYKGLIDTPKVNAIDTTGAGDIFCGAVAVKLGEGCNLKEAVLFANTSAAISVTRFGAQSSIPYKEEVFDFLKTTR
ncbi:Ribokinase [bioreactor metagenome]|uniref:Ribokinase n=1 Tax=bioreactor metagenome TaxID=1076179 RepID=A0A645EWW1_9ZZZZ